MNEYHSILYLFVPELHHDGVFHPSDDDSSDTKTNSDNACINPELPPGQTRMYGTLYLDNCQAGKHMQIKHFFLIESDMVV